MPLPRFWYFPRGEKAVVVMTGDDHGNGGTTGQFDWDSSPEPRPAARRQLGVRPRDLVHLQRHALGQRWPRRYEAQGFEVAPPRQHGLRGLDARVARRLLRRPAGQLRRRPIPSVAPPVDQPHALHHVERLGDPAEGRAGPRHPPRHELLLLAGGLGPGSARHFTGSGMPMRFADLDGSLIDVYQAATQMTDESGITYSTPHRHAARQRHRRARLLRRRSRRTCTPTTHPSGRSRPSSPPPLRAAFRSSRRDRCCTGSTDATRSSFGDLTWNSGTLTFDIGVGAGANGLQGDAPRRRANRRASVAQPQRRSRPVHPSDDQGHRVRDLLRGGGRIHGGLRGRHHRTDHLGCGGRRARRRNGNDHLDNRRVLGQRRALRHVVRARPDRQHAW